MFGAGFISLARWSILQDKDKAVTFFPLFLAEALHNKVIVTNLKLFLIFLKIGAILYGSGYVLFAFLDTDLVKNGIISRSQLIDAIAVGQFTPGPVLSSVTFIGYQIGNFEGALVSTFAVFLPSLFFVLAINPFMKKMRESKSFRAFLDAVNISSVAIIAAVCLQLGNQAISDPRTALIAGVNLFIVFKYRKLNSAVLVLASALLGRILLLLPF
jgi:chromate transporter